MQGLTLTNTEQLKSLFDSLKATNSIKEKEKMLEAYSGHEGFLEVLNFLLNPYIVTGLSDKKINRKVSCKPSGDLTANTPLRSVLEYLKTHNNGCDAVIAEIQHYIFSQSVEVKEFLEQVFTKTLRIGCDAKVVNRVLGDGFIPTFDVQLANKYFDFTHKVEGKSFTITPKIDGQRCIAIKENGVISLFSRQGQALHGLVEIEGELSKCALDNCMLDGELLSVSDENLTSAERYKQTLKITRKDGEKRGICFLVFDYMSAADFHSKCNTTPYTERRMVLDDGFGSLVHIKPLGVLYSGADTSQIIAHLNLARSSNQEGVMININDAPYEFKRTSNLLKVKVMADCDLKIVGFEEGSGRLSGTLGRINVEYKDGVVGVGSGFSDEDREFFWSNQSTLLGRVVTVQYFEETEDKDGVKSLRFPVFKELREVGKDVSYT